MTENGTQYEKGFNGAEYIKFKIFEKHSDKFLHCFTTRNKGASSGECSSLNLGFNRNDKKENVIKNFELIAQALEIKIDNMVLSNQIHDNRIKYVDESDRGKGTLFRSDILGYDGLITDKKEVALVTFYADCVPIYLFDPVKEVISCVHSGWRSTYKEISIAAVEKMRMMFGSNLEDIEVAIGPAIGFCCFEVGEDVYKLFKNKFEHIEENVYLKSAQNKWKINLNAIIIKNLIRHGLKENKISDCCICTKCNNDKYYSFRGDNGKTGSLAAIMQLK